MTVTEWVISHFQLIGLACIDVNVIFAQTKSKYKHQLWGKRNDLFHATVLKLMSNVFVEYSLLSVYFSAFATRRSPHVHSNSEGQL